MKLSIVTISFNQAPFLERAMRSVLDQNWPDLEYIVVDPGSTDGSRDIIEKYRDRLTVVYEKDKGPADGLNHGFAQATGDVCGYLNADDAFLPGAFAGVARAFGRHPGADVVIGDGFMAGPDGRFLKRVRSTSFTPWWFVHGGVLILQQSTFFRRQAFLAVPGGFNVENRTSWDAELVLDMALAGRRIVNVHEDWSAFTVHPDSITGSQRLAQESFRQHDRYFQKVMGRNRTALDRRLQKLGRLRKWLLDPMALWYGVQDRLLPLRGGLAG